MDKETVGVVFGIAALLAVIFGTVLFSQSQKLDCIKANAGRPALETQALCGKL